MSRDKSESESLPPHDPVAETAMLGACLIRTEAVATARKLCSPEDCYRPSHTIIYRAILRVVDSGGAPDIISVANELNRSQELIRIPRGAAYVASLVDVVPRSSNVEYYARTVSAKARLRRILEVTERLSRSIRQEVDEDDWQARLKDLLEASVREPGVRRAADLWSPEVIPTAPEFTVRDFFRRKGLHLIWAPPGGLKTFTLLHAEHQLLGANPAELLFGHPDLLIKKSYKRVLWVATEEDISALRFRAEAVRRGLGKGYELGGELRHLFASVRPRITLDDLPSVLDVEGPLDAVVLDSLTGLRPKTKGGRAIQWDIDNDAANEACLELRELTARHQIAIKIVHHTGRDQTKGYRGPTDWWASADMMIGLIPDESRTRVVVEKNRDGRILDPFYLQPSWGPEGFYLSHAGAAPRTGVKTGLSGTAHQAKAYLEQYGEATPAELVKVLGCARSTMQAVVKSLLEKGIWEETGHFRDRSPLYRPKGATK